MHHPKLEEMVRRDPRYAYEAYEFMFAALAHTQQLLGRVPPDDAPPDEDHHVSGPELLEGIRDLARREFGLMARAVFNLWGIQRTADFGQIVFNLVEANLMSKTPDDTLDDFVDFYDLEALTEGYRIDVPAEADG
jgi:uncharacterized repeat protein (TIGR04138 family)